MPANIDISYRVEILRSLAYLFLHPELESGVELLWNPVGDAPDEKTYTFRVDARVMERTLVRLRKAEQLRGRRTRR